MILENSMIYFSLQTPSIPTLEETQAVVQEVHQDLQQLKPNAILETIRSWTPGLLSFSYRLLYAAIIIIIGNRIAFYLRRFLKRTFDRMGMDLGLSKFLISLANAIAYAIVIFMALEKSGSIHLYYRPFRLRHPGYWPVSSGKPGKFCRRHPHPGDAALWHP